MGRIGQGAHGYVMKAYDKINGKSVALKKLSIKTLEEGIPKKIMREICALRTLKCRFVSSILHNSNILTLTLDCRIIRRFASWDGHNFGNGIFAKQFIRHYSR